jgi:hypothetical protein
MGFLTRKTMRRWLWFSFCTNAVMAVLLASVSSPAVLISLATCAMNLFLLREETS